MPQVRNSRARWRRIVGVAPSVAGLVGSSLASFYAGDVGMASAAAGAGFGLVDALGAARKLRSIEEMLERLGDRVDRLESPTPEGVDLIAHGLDVAAGLRSEELLLLSSRVTADALETGATAPQQALAHRLLNVMRQLEPDHLRVLRELRTIRSADGTEVHGPVQVGTPFTGLSRPLPDLTDVMEQLLSWLRALGLAEVANERQMSSPNFQNVHAGPSPAEWGLTRFGEQLLDHLESP